MLDLAIIIHRFDALHLSVKLFAAGHSGEDDAVGAEVPGLDIMGGGIASSFRNLCAYGGGPDEAVNGLWQAILDMDSSEWLRVSYTSNRLSRFYRWNGAAWKEREPGELTSGAA